MWNHAQRPNRPLPDGVVCAARLDAEDLQMEVASLRAGLAALKEDWKALQEELPQLQGNCDFFLIR